MKKNYYQIQNVKRGWRKIPHAIFYDEDLTSDAKVVISELLAVSGEFNISEAGIAGSVHMSLERVKKAVRLLKATGYIQLTRIKDGSRFVGCQWGISDTKGTFRETENRANGNQSSESQSSETAEEIDGVSGRLKTVRMETLSNENLPIYQTTNNQRRTIKDENQDHMNQDGISTSSYSPSPTSVQQTSRVGEEAEGFLPYNPSFTPQPSSVANAPSLSKNTGSQPSVISQKEYLYQQFLKKYPKKPTGMDAAATKQAFFDIPDLEDIFAEIMEGLDAWCNSVDWTKEGGRYITKPLNFITTRKWEEIPRTIKTEIDPDLLRFMMPPNAGDLI